LATTYLGAMPESGKGQFTERFTRQVAQSQARYPRARPVVLSDGATWNWPLLETHYPDAIGILAFWHAAQPLGEAADAIFGAASSAAQTAWVERWRTILRDEPNGKELSERESCSAPCRSFSSLTVVLYPLPALCLLALLFLPEIALSTLRQWTMHL